VTNDLPARFGRYEVEGVLGSGGFATVYRGHDPLLDRAVAIKALHPHIATEENARARFLAEARLLATLHEPHIVAVHDVGEQDGRPYFVMQFVPGETAATRVARTGPLPLGLAASLLTEVAAAVDALHARGIMHRDVTAANVMLTPDGHAMLMDLGIALGGGNPRLTRGYGLGTPESAAPEQIHNEALGPAADIYAFGVLAYTLLTGQPPFRGDTAHVLYAHAHTPPPSPRSLNPALPETAAAAITAALAKNPAERPATASAIAARLLAPAGASEPTERLDATWTTAGESGAHTADLALAAGFTTISLASDEPNSLVQAELHGDGRTLLSCRPSSPGYHGVRALLLPDSGQYQLRVEATGPWRCEVAQPSIAAQQGVVEESGHGDAVVYLRLSAGVRSFVLRHNVWRAGRFRAWLADDSATVPDALAVASGSYAGAPARRVAEAGVQALVIEAAGAWSVRVE
jgi:serine/threonine protein kinase